jgi:acyl-CoA thioesterase-1
MKIACIGDSLGMPRENVLYEDTWFFRVQQSHPEKMFISCFQRSLTTDMLLDNFDEYSFIKPDYLILQLGICDCAPRLINDKSFLLVLCHKIRKGISLSAVVLEVY